MLLQLGYLLPLFSLLLPGRQVLRPAADPSRVMVLRDAPRGKMVVNQLRALAEHVAEAALAEQRSYSSVGLHSQHPSAPLRSGMLHRAAWQEAPRDQTPGTTA